MRYESYDCSSVTSRMTCGTCGTRTTAARVAPPPHNWSEACLGDAVAMACGDGLEALAEGCRLRRRGALR
eukprot:6537953-Prymnesium_polylepis.1